jgi:hypothetical protein
MDIVVVVHRRPSVTPQHPGLLGAIAKIVSPIALDATITTLAGDRKDEAAQAGPQPARTGYQSQ